MTPKIAACLITKNSAGTIAQALEPLRPFVDGVFVYDTGSTDDTFELLEKLNDRVALVLNPDGTLCGPRLANGEMESVGDELLAPVGGERAEIPLAPIVVERGEWREDFAWARAQSWAMPDESFDWMLWLDDDDVIEGAQTLRMLVASANADVDGFVVQYDYARDASGQCVCVLWRERLIRRAAGYEWTNAVHEVLIPPNGQPARLVQLPPNVLRYIHNRPADRYDPDRNLKILRHHAAEIEERGEPLDPRTLAYLGTELMTKGEFQEAAGYLQAYLARADAAWSDERMQVAHKLAICARALGNPFAAVEVEMQALKERDDWAETYVGLAETFAQLGRWDRVERWAKQALELGMPPSALILNPLEFSLLPMLRLVEACQNQGRFAEAEQWLAQAAAASPGQPVVNEKALELRQAKMHGEALEHLLGLREVLVRHDENEKAYHLLERAVPYVIGDHPAVVKARADQREMVRHMTHPDEYRRWYEDEPKESTLTDDHIDLVGDWFGRIAGLHRGLQAQEAELGRAPVVLDLGCNDWWMGEFLARHGYRCDGIELNKKSYENAIARRDRFDRSAIIAQGDLHNARALLEERATEIDLPPGGYDAVVMYEVLEHVPDVQATLDVMESLCRPGGRVYLSTPNGAFEQGNLDSWARVERKGHLRAIPLHDLADMLMARGEIEDLEHTNGDRVGFASYTPKPRRGSVTFYAGGQWEPWSPVSLRDGGIGGSETALVQVASHLATEGWRVKVYSSSESGLIGGVLYRPFTAWDPTEDVDLLVVSRRPDIFDNPIGAKRTALWCHDHSYDTLTKDRASKIDQIVVLSDWQRDRFARLYPYAADKLTIIRNGIWKTTLDGTDHFPDGGRGYDARKPRVVYSSSADRGLDVMLDLWPRIRERVPDAELHVFYGFNVLDRVAVTNPQLAAFKGAILAKAAELGGEDAGIFLRGRVGQVELAREMQEARLLAYPTSFLETSCITAMEAKAAGLPMVTSHLGALPETGWSAISIPWCDDEDEPHNRTAAYQDEFVEAAVAVLSNPVAWQHAHELALTNIDQLDWSCRTTDWEALADATAALTASVAA